MLSRAPRIDPELVHGVKHVVLRWWVHEVEEEQILNPQRLEQQDYIGEVSPLDFWDGGSQHFSFICTLSIESEKKKRTQRWV